MPASQRPSASPVRGPASSWDAPSVPRGAVVVALDAGPADRAALGWAVERARAAHRPLHLVHARDDDTAAARASVRALTADLAPGAGVTTVTEPVVPHLVDLSRGAHLVVLGDTLLRAALGRPGRPVAVLLAMRSRCPVVVVPRGDDAADAPAPAHPRQMSERAVVVVGVDGTHAGRGALELAFTQASSRGAQLKAVHAWPPTAPGAAPDERQGGWPERRAMVATLLAGFRERHPDVVVVTHLVREEPVVGLVRRSRGAELLVLSGCSGEGRLGLLPGAVTMGVLDHAPCPVAMVRDGDVGDHLRGVPGRSGAPALAPRADEALVRA